ncbi:hypothetical protein IOK49_06300 [Fervidicoccus fontis]|uniref:CS domain-containing protein n=3 Tax=Fervidicoccus fontis TaxID=683846 RepID=I0A092_FERFK|nr:hypothetical protein [Fervidicoccus fontis]AFH42399.1 hypothetical protein FFONT_0409 [Fervidicoccus fontis Kam940]MBE9391674.1 hypothetical protein [Fervidicoccus fontis]PMB76103.1 MAG: hypothetical protein C0188_00320 [Fervidicoccus fontis]HEW64392.1 hypothetical protein [Fervidicoccus fontis]
MSKKDDLNDKNLLERIINSFLNIFFNYNNIEAYSIAQSLTDIEIFEKIDANEVKIYIMLPESLSEEQVKVVPIDKNHIKIFVEKYEEIYRKIKLHYKIDIKSVQAERKKKDLIVLTAKKKKFLKISWNQNH